MTEMMMKLGGFKFSVNTGAYNSLVKSSEWRWQAQQRLWNDSALQYTGKGETAITLEGIIYPHYKGGIGQMDRMRDEADKAEPLPLVDGAGRYHGLWVIVSINEKQTDFLPGGMPRKQTFTMKIKYYVKDWL